MNLRIPVVLLATSTALVAQGNVYSPGALGAGEGSGYSYYYGRYANMRHQQIVSDLGSTALVLKGFSLRLDNRSHSTTSTASGRSWSNVTVYCSDGDIGTFTATWATNAASTPVMVFSGSMTWATQSGYPTNTPATWGGAGQNFPFGTGGSASTFLYSGASDLLIDTTFSGGTMANGYTTWSTSTSSGVSYYNDNENVPSPWGSVSGAGRYVPTTRLNNTSSGVVRCNDSEHTSSTGSYLYAVATSYGPLYSLYNYRDKLRWYTYSYYTAYEAPVLHAVGFNTLETGFDIGTGCNRLHAGGPLIIYALKTLPKSYSTSGYSGYLDFLVPHKASYVGLKAIAQAAWTDSVTGKLQLSQAYERTIPGLITSSGPPFMMTYRYGAAGTTGFGPYDYFYLNCGFCFAK